MNPEAILRALLAHDVAFVLVGGLAATAHGSSLTTFDVDICYDLEASNRHALAAALLELEAEVYPPRTNRVAITADLLLRYRHINLKSPHGRIDVLAEVPGLGPYRELVEGVRPIEIAGLLVPVLTLDQLIEAKRAVDRPKDRDHLDHLLAIRDRLRGGD